MRALLAALVLGCLALVACGGDGGQTKALKATLAYFGDDPAEVPPVATDYACGITVAVRPVSPSPTISPVEATCRWDMEQLGDNWHLTFVETWACKDFNVTVDPYPKCSPPTGSHKWEFLVDSSLHVSGLPDSGNFAPDMNR